MAGSGALLLTALSRSPAQAATDEFVKYDGMSQAELVRSALYVLHCRSLDFSCASRLIFRRVGGHGR